MRGKGRKQKAKGDRGGRKDEGRGEPRRGLRVTLRARSMLSFVLFYLAGVVGGPGLAYVWLERRHRHRWPEAPGAPVPAGQGAYRRGLVAAPAPGRAPLRTRVAALLLLVGSGFCFFDA